jgi:hypothetical protein
MPRTASVLRAGISPKIPATHSAVLEYAEILNAWVRSRVPENRGASWSITWATMYVPSRARAKETIAPATAFPMGVRTVPRRGEFVPISTEPMAVATGPIAASGTT